MFEFHGWAVVRSTSGRRVFRPDGLYYPDDDTLRDSLSHQIEGSGLAEWVHIHRTVNGLTALSASGLRNHRDERIFDLFRWLAVQGKRSYGFLFTRDDEGADCGPQFHVLRLARGEFELTPQSLIVPEDGPPPEPEYERGSAL